MGTGEQGMTQGDRDLEILEELFSTVSYAGDVQPAEPVNDDEELVSTDTEQKRVVVTPGGRIGNNASRNRSPKENWVDKRGGLPEYIRIVRNGLIREGKPEGRATALAVAAMKRWARGGDSVSPKVQAAAAKALAQWEAMKASKSDSTDETKAEEETEWDEGSVTRVPAGEPGGGQFAPASGGSGKPAEDELQSAVVQVGEDEDELQSATVEVGKPQEGELQSEAVQVDKPDDELQSATVEINKDGKNPNKKPRKIPGGGATGALRTEVIRKRLEGRR